MTTIAIQPITSTSISDDDFTYDAGSAGTNKSGFDFCGDHSSITCDHGNLSTKTDPANINTIPKLKQFSIEDPTFKQANDALTGKSNPLARLNRLHFTVDGQAYVVKSNPDSKTGYSAYEYNEETGKTGKMIDKNVEIYSEGEEGVNCFEIKGVAGVKKGDRLYITASDNGTLELREASEKLNPLDPDDAARLMAEPALHGEIYLIDVRRLSMPPLKPPLWEGA
jgi:hypothetical protein